MNSPDKLNLLVIISDEHRRDAMGCMGHPVVSTPHLDALAALVHDHLGGWPDQDNGDAALAERQRRAEDTRA